MTFLRYSGNEFLFWKWKKSTAWICSSLDTTELSLQWSSKEFERKSTTTLFPATGHGLSTVMKSPSRPIGGRTQNRDRPIKSTPGGIRDKWGQDWFKRLKMKWRSLVICTWTCLFVVICINTVVGTVIGTRRNHLKLSSSSKRVIGTSETMTIYKTAKRRCKELLRDMLRRGVLTETEKPMNALAMD